VALGVIYLAISTRGFRRRPPAMSFSEDGEILEKVEAPRAG
jgi:hypothetical protein